VSEIVSVTNLRHQYGDRVALDDVTLNVEAGHCFALLGPNGGGKSTLFRILATLLNPTAGRATIAGYNVVNHRAAVRRLIGVVFQSPSLDVYLTVRENLLHGGRLYGLAWPDLSRRIEAVLDQFGIAERRDDRVKALSGGLRRRVEIAKAMLHRPQVLILDEPSTGLDPRARRELWDHLRTLADHDGVTVLLTTHDMDEADRADHVAILDRGRLVATGTPEALKSRIGEACVSIETSSAATLRDRIAERFECRPIVVDGQVRIEGDTAVSLVGDLLKAFGDAITTVTVGRPTLGDVFMHETGRRLEEAER